MVVELLLGRQAFCLSVSVSVSMSVSGWLDRAGDFQPQRKA